MMILISFLDEDQRILGEQTTYVGDEPPNAAFEVPEGTKSVYLCQTAPPDVPPIFPAE